ncbi:MAG: hypothetical protein ACTSO9_03265 [Candidatus Helarchaeota archaeon]
MGIDETTKDFMKELIEFISLIRASEKERYEIQKQFMDDTINTIKDISESIKATEEYLRTNMEKLKEILTSGISTIRKDMNIDTIVEAKNVLGESIDILQKETQLHAFRQTMQEIRSSIEELQQMNLSKSLNNLKNVATEKVPEIQAASKPQVKPKPVQVKEVGTTAVEEEKKTKRTKKPTKISEKYHIDF